MIPQETLEALTARFAAIEDEMSSVTESDAIVRLSKEHAELKPVVDAAQELITARVSISDLDEMVAGEDKDMADMAGEELREIKERLPELEKELQIMLLPKDKADSSNVVLEIRAGTGGDEAAIFAGDLFRMYQRYASIQGWKVEIMSAAEADMGGYKEIQASVTGDNIFAKMKFESGVHRVQRVPETETQGRVHTSAATVAVLPEAEDIDIDIRNEDLRIDTMRASGAGGQHVNTTDSAVRITHLPTGVVVTSSVKSQHQNRAYAMTALRAKLYDIERQKVDKERADARKGQVGSGDRSERIRTYNYPQGRVTDHRINLTLYKLDKIIAGDEVGELIDALITQDQADRLAAMEGAY